MTNGYEFDQTAAYQIRLKGILDTSWSDWFGGFTITVQGDETPWLESCPTNQLYTASWRRSTSWVCHSFR
jgi:hypothetical protein